MTDFLRQMAEKADDGILYADKEGIIRYWNYGCERIFGFTRDEAEGANLDLIIPEKHRDRHWKGWFKVLETGETSYRGKMLKVPAIKKSGEKLIIEFSMQIIEENGENVGFTSVIRDVTLRS
ncbi:PAS domain S-box protein [Seleniivibrio woodruffii]|uniref:PAS domain S-box-containing protein n=1 Tax=Seleniivibrio woodruffii TaxID=1078050 RepID=A0A4R1K976_9BACT|nr:PAS domain S-box protein [Seleniivibrio woodruffii]TCK60938.1 PAS domain S-box-containing protein [Seleniivibrio woodruffii]TVZ36568.1 PAS domain S-box-containing protein [Seleniivibrio woodruffii]